MKRRFASSVLAACLAMTGSSCAPDPDSTGSLSPVGVVACSDQVFWATVTGADQPPSAEGVRVVVREWLKPTAGPAEMTVSLASTTSIKEREPFVMAISSTKADGQPSTFSGEDARSVASAAGTRESCPSGY